MTDTKKSKYLAQLLIAPVLALILVLFIVLSMNDGSISQTNYWLLQKEWFIDLNRVLSQFPSFWLNVTMLGDALIFLPILSFFIMWKPRTWAALFGAIPLATLLCHGGKILLAVPRPAAVLDNDTFTIIGYTMNLNNSLPSGHTITIFTAVTVVTGVYLASSETPRYILWILIGLVIATFLSISRVAVGAHWPLDIVVGAALGYISGLSGIFLTYRYHRWWKWLKRRDYWFIWSVLMLFWSVQISLNAIEDESQNLIIVWFSALCGFIVSIYLLSHWVLERKSQKVAA